MNGEEVGASNASALQAAGISGTGAKVAIVDLGFGGLAQRQADGEIPSSAVTVDYCIAAGFNTEVHGTAVTEVVHEMAPAAQLYLICIDTEVELGQASSTPSTTTSRSSVTL